MGTEMEALRGEEEGLGVRGGEGSSTLTILSERASSAVCSSALPMASAGSTADPFAVPFPSATFPSGPRAASTSPSSFASFAFGSSKDEGIEDAPPPTLTPTPEPPGPEPTLALSALLPLPLRPAVVLLTTLGLTSPPLALKLELTLALAYSSPSPSPSLPRLTAIASAGLTVSSELLGVPRAYKC